LNRASPTPLSEATERPEAVRVIILGCGRVGRYVSDALRATDVSHLVVDYHGEAIERLQAVGVPSVYGDATSEHVLEQTHPERAELAVVALPEAAMTEMAVRALKSLSPDLAVIARVHRGMDIPRIRAAGAEAVIHAEFEAGMEMIEQGLERLGFEHTVIDKYLDSLRQVRYRGAELKI
jgi:monovalent cation:H+ antiporter-2, CPA2 family